MAKETRLGTATYKLPSDELKNLVSSSDVVHDREALLDAFAKQGYIYLSGFLPADTVLKARTAVLEHIQKCGGALDPSQPLEEGILLPTCGAKDVPFMEGQNEITSHPAVMAVIEHQKVRDLFGLLFGEPASTFDYKWLRAVPKEVFTGAHVDNVYMSRGTKRLYTMWFPFGNINTSMGTLAMCEGSHCLPGFKPLQDTYGSMDVEAEGLQGTGWFTTDPEEIRTRFGGQWRTGDFAAGDVILFGTRTMHMSTVNTTNLVRISCDTRWYPSSEQPDPRYVGAAVGHVDAVFGVHASDKPQPAKKGTTMELKRAEWGFV